MVSYFPHRSRDLVLYQLLILCTFSRFGGSTWRWYDDAFRRDAAARGVVDWSHMNVELWNFHTASASRASRLPRPPFTENQTHPPPG